MKKFLPSILFLTLLVSSIQVFGQTLMPLPPHNNTYTGNVRGYWFTAPTDFTITGLRVPADAGANPQYIHVMKINVGVPAFTWANVTTGFTTLAYISNGAAGVIQNVNVNVYAGDIIGILGQSNNVGSYTTATSPFNTTIGGLPVQLNRLLHQNTLLGGPAANVSYEPNLEIARVEMYYTQGVPCSTHFSQAIVNGPAEVCANKNFNLYVGIADGRSMTGLTIQWEKSVNGSTWGNFTGTVNNNGVLTDAINAPAWYRARIICDATGQTMTTAPKKVDMAPFYYCYCDNSRATAAAGAADIGNVTIDKLPGGQVLMNNGAGVPTYSNTTSNKSYTDFRQDPTTPPMPIYADSIFRLYVRQINSGTAMIGTTALAWLDFNRNGTFDPWEQILQKSPSATPLVPGQVFDTFSVEADSFRYGLTGLRVVLRTGAIANPADPCANYSDGETEDYLIDMRYTPCTGKPFAGRVESDTSMCIGYGYVVTDTSYQKYVHGIETSWEESGDGVAWFPVPNSANKDTLMRVFMGQPVYYRMLVKCTHSGDSSYTDPFRVNVKPTYKCYCHSQSMGGATDTSDIGAYNLGSFNTNDGGSHLGNPRAVRQRQDWTDLPEIEMYVDSLYEFFVYHTMPNKVHADAKITVFVDFNNNKKYDIPAERIYTGFTSSGNFTRLGKVPIPADVITDVPTGMRVVLNNEVAPNIPSDEGCGEYVSGETEDYIVRFTRRLFPVSVNEIDGMGNISLYPNPTSGKFTLSYSGASGNVQVRVSTVTGQVLQERVIENKGRSVSEEFDLGGRASGIYFVEVEANGAKKVERLFIK